MRGGNRPLGSENIAANGYHYVKTSTGWRLKHHLVAEEMLGRPLEANERVSFKDGNRDNFHPSNIVVNQKGSNGKSKNSQINKRMTTIEDKMRDLIEDSPDRKLVIRELQEVIDHLREVYL